MFNSEKTACATCHKIGYVGGVIGPDLTSIGRARTERDLLEAIEIRPGQVSVLPGGLDEQSTDQELVRP